LYTWFKEVAQNIKKDFKIFTFKFSSYLDCSQIWLNLPMDPSPLWVHQKIDPKNSKHLKFGTWYDIIYCKGRRDEMKLPLNPSVIHPVIRPVHPSKQNKHIFPSILSSICPSVQSTPWKLWGCQLHTIPLLSLTL
jgi:hypothetical protein